SSASRLMATVTDTVEVVAGFFPEVVALDARVEEVRRRFSRAIIDRYLALLPTAGVCVLIALGAAVVGAVRFVEDVSVWYGGVLRGDLASVTVGARTNIQDGTVLHVADDGFCVVGADVIVGHRAMLHVCRVEDACLIGMQATVLDDAVIDA